MPNISALGHNVDSKEEVDSLMQQAKQAGATVVKEAQDTLGWILRLFPRSGRASVGDCVESEFRGAGEPGRGVIFTG
jgi:hypothetical protein